MNINAGACRKDPLRNGDEQRTGNVTGARNVACGDHPCGAQQDGERSQQQGNTVVGELAFLQSDPDKIQDRDEDEKLGLDEIVKVHIVFPQARSIPITADTSPPARAAMMAVTICCRRIRGRSSIAPIFSS